MLLQHKDLLPLVSQRVAAMFLLYELYRSDQPSANPFAQFFVELLQPQVEDDRVVNGVSYGHSLSAVEKWFLSQLVNSTPKDVCVMNSSLRRPSCCYWQRAFLLLLATGLLVATGNRHSVMCHMTHSVTRVLLWRMCSNHCTMWSKLQSASIVP